MTPSYRVPDNIASEVVSGETVLLDLSTGEYYALNPTATVVFESLRGGQSLASCADALRERFAAAATDDVFADATELANDLVAKGLLVIA